MERVIAAPLSGEEIVEAVLDRVRKQLLTDCNLNPVFAYEAFEGRIRIDLRMTDCGRIPEIEIDETVKVGAAIDPNDPDAALGLSDQEFGKEPPNTVRQTSGQPVPVLVEDSQGRKEIKKIQYAKPGKAKPVAPVAAEVLEPLDTL